MPLKVNTIEPDGNVVPAFAPTLESVADVACAVLPHADPHDDGHCLAVGCVVRAVTRDRAHILDILDAAIAHPDPLAACRLLADKLRGAP